MSDIATSAAAPSARASEIRAMLALAWPLILTNLAQMAITTTDVVMMGWLGPQALAAGTLGANLFYAPFLFGIGLAVATAPAMAQAVGRRAGVLRAVRRAAGQGFLVCLIYSLPVWALLWHAEAILLLLGQDPALSAEAQDYMRALQWSLLPGLMFVVLRSFLSALERPRAALVVTVLAIVLNAVSNWVLMFGHWGVPAMGVVGAGVSSTIANAFMVVGLLVFCSWDRGFRRFRLAAALLRPDLHGLGGLLRVGLPIGLAMGFEVTVFNVATMLMGLIGPTALAAHAIALQVSSITFMVPMGLGQAATVRVGLAAGRGDHAGLGRAGWTALALGMGFMTCMALLLLGAPQPIVGVFLDLTDPASAAVAPLAAALLGIAGLFQVFDGAQVVGAGALRGLQDTRRPMIFAALGYWATGMPLAALLAFGAGLGGIGIWVGLLIGLAVVAGLMVARWHRREALGLVPRG
ncbi:MATE family efflux transporter [Arenibaculum pallidiluteum]|uniref:MATE family efflux transporter n=1 Tax=Arenibaculum pallidiluteum TaxID=2812559 RepID=UPI001A978AC1|nr:MATE family efflux transporter [Arenibaculum pallidiluteum]